MQRKKSLIIFSTVLMVVLLAVSTTSTNAALTNNWGVDEGTTLNYKIEVTDGDYKESYGLEISIVTVADLDTPIDDHADLFYTYEEKSEDGVITDAGNGRISGKTYFYELHIIYPMSHLDIPVLPVDADGGYGLDWSAQKTNIEFYYASYDEVTVTESGDTYKVVAKTTYDSIEWGSTTYTKEVEWDTNEGVLKYYLVEIERTEADITTKTEVTQGELSEGFLEGNAPIIAAAALGLAFLAFLMILVKK